MVPGICKSSTVVIPILLPIRQLCGLKIMKFCSGSPHSLNFQSDYEQKEVIKYLHLKYLFCSYQVKKTLETKTEKC